MSYTCYCTSQCPAAWQCQRAYGLRRLGNFEKSRLRERTSQSSRRTRSFRLESLGGNGRATKLILLYGFDHTRCVKRGNILIADGMGISSGLGFTRVQA